MHPQNNSSGYVAAAPQADVKDTLQALLDLS